MISGYLVGIFIVTLIVPVIFPTSDVEIHREPLWPKGKRIFMPDCKNPSRSIVGLLERNPIHIVDPNSEITYYLFPKKDTDATVKVDMRNLEELTKYVEPEGLWVFGIHGFDGDYTAGPIFRSTARDIHAARVSNIVQVDWKSLAAAPWYLSAKDNTKIVGMHVASMVTQLILKSLAQPEKIQLVGFSLGAHVAGYAGKTLGEKYRLRQHRITGLDPAGPGYERESKGNRLDSSDGRYVEVFHTSAGFLGAEASSGHVDYYVNGGKPSQPDCPWTESLTLYSCSHQFAVKMFDETINGSIKAHKCRDTKSAVAGSCSIAVLCNVGFILPNCPSGVYYIGTN